MPHIWLVCIAKYGPGFIYHFEANPRYLPLTQELLMGVQAGQWAAVTSVVTLMELTVRPWQLDRPNVAREYEALLVHFPHLTLVEVTRDIARRAAQLRAHHQARQTGSATRRPCWR